MVLLAPLVLLLLIGRGIVRVVRFFCVVVFLARILCFLLVLGSCRRSLSRRMILLLILLGGIRICRMILLLVVLFLLVLCVSRGLVFLSRFLCSHSLLVACL